jgi:SAM-dependent methyltransferase
VQIVTVTDTESTRFRDFYRKEASIYHGRRYETRYGRLFRELHHSVLSGMLKDVPATHPALEIACGTGHTSSLLAREGISFIACDLTPHMLAEARDRMERADHPTSFLYTDAQALPFPDATFNLVVTTRFLHLFPAAEQRIVLSEAARVLKPGGSLVVDFDNWTSRWIFSLPLLVYNLLRYRRAAPYSIYNRIGATRRMLDEVGISPESVQGIGGPHLIVLDWIFHSLALRIGHMHRYIPLRVLAEQFMVLGKRR